jgi:hypothetical protein
VRQFLQSHRILLFNSFAGLCLLLQIQNLQSFVVQGADHVAIVAVNDDDASWNIVKTVKTRWWKDNGWALYGPFYMRLNHSLQYFWERTGHPGTDSAGENWERTAHLAIMTLSLLSLFGVGLLVSAFLLEPWWARFVATMAFSSAFLSDPVWSRFVLRAHPDHLFSMFAVAGLWLTFLMFEQPAEGAWRKLSATIWGFSMSVKMTLTVCTPGFFFLFIPPMRNENFKAGLRYLGWMFAAYLLIGFPQTIKFDRPFRDLAELSSVGTSPTAESIRHWFWLYATQGWRPLLVLALAGCLLPRRRRNVASSTNARLGIFVFLPFLFLLSKNMLVPWDHYPMAFISMLLFYLAILISQLPEFRRFEWPRAAVFVVLFFVLLGTTPAVIQNELGQRLTCRSQARDTYARVAKLYSAGEHVWVDPYVPFVTTGEKGRMDVEWVKTFESLTSGGWTVLALNAKFREPIIREPEPSEYVRHAIDKWREVREFYKAFDAGTDVTVPGGRKFHREYRDSCGLEVWTSTAPSR